MNTAQPESLLRKIVSAWTGKIALAKAAKKDFDDVAAQCMVFFDSTSRRFWDKSFQRKFFGKTLNSRFQLSIGKAFELIALFGPSLYHRNPTRAVRPYEPIPVPPSLFGDIQNDQNLQQQYQMTMAQEEQDHARNTFRCQLMEHYLSYTPREQPAGGLEEAARLVITEALVKGRGVLFAESYRHPGSQRRLTGLFYETVDRVLIDPDATSHHFGEARWMTRKHIDPTWVVERKYGLRKGALKKRGTVQSNETAGAIQAHEGRASEVTKGNTFDLMEYWEIWSIGGVGTRMSGQSEWVNDAFDEVVGDYAYIVVAPSVEYPLNCPLAKDCADPADSMEASTDEQVKEMFSWPVPYYRDQKWPCVFLDFYTYPHDPKNPQRSAWPMAPLGPCIGELTMLNIIISEFLNSARNGSRTFIAMAESMAKDFEKVFDDGGDFAKIRVPDSLMQRGLKEVVEFMRAPDVSGDVVKMIEMLFHLVEQRSGLSEIMYAMNPGGGTPRTATDVASKTQSAGVRPDDMAKRVAACLSQGAELEKICAYWSGISSQDIAPLLGPVASQFWDELITNEEPDVMFYGMRCTVEANDVRKPDKARDAQNMAQLYPPMSQQLAQYCAATGNMEPLNALNRKMFDAIEQPWEEELAMQPIQPPQQQGQEQQQAAQQQEQQMAQQEMEAKQAREQMKAQHFEGEQQRKQQSHEMKMAQDTQKAKWDQAKSFADMIQQYQEGRAKIENQAIMTEAKTRLNRINSRMKKHA